MPSAMSYIMEMIAVIIAIAVVVPIAMLLLFNGTEQWGSTPSYIITLLTTVVAIFFALGIMLKMMPTEVRGRVGLFATYNHVVINAPIVSRKRQIIALNHFEV